MSGEIRFPAPSGDAHRHEFRNDLAFDLAVRVGIGLVPRILVEEELLNGELACLGEPIISRRSYYLVYPTRNGTLPSLKAFSDWLMQTL